MANHAQMTADPFQPEGMIRDHNRFFGRAQELNFLWGRVQNGGNVSIVGERRMGKSSLLWHVQYQANDRDSSRPRAHYIDMALIADEQTFLREVATFLSDSISEPTWLEVSKVVRGKPHILCIDEFARTADNGRFTKDFFDGLRGASQQGLVLVVASKDPLRTFLKDPVLTSGLATAFPEPLEIGPLDRDAARELLKECAKRAGLELDPETIGKALELSECIPWRVQLIGSKLFHHQGKWQPAKDAYERERRSVDPPAVRPLPNPQTTIERAGRHVAVVGVLGIFAILIGMVGGMAGSGGALTFSVILILLTLGLTAVFLLRRR